MNRRQRESNRLNAKVVKDHSIICPECGERGAHWIGLPYTMQNMIDNSTPDGFWACPRLYGTDGRRITP